MNERAKTVLRNFSYALTSNLVLLIFSTLVLLIVPKVMGVEEYGYWQLYLFYSSYVPFFLFGWNDGIYLRYGGAEYSDLDKGLFFSQFYMQVLLQFAVAALLFAAAVSSGFDADRRFIFQMTAVFLVLVNIRYMLLYVLQSTNRIKEYAQITIMDKILCCCLIIAVMLAGIREYQWMIAADLVGKAVSLLYAMRCCREIVLRRLATFYFSFREAMANVQVGSKLMVSNTASMLLIGVIRFGIERSWDVSTFGKVSLSLNISSFMMIFISAVGLILFPLLRRLDEARLPSLYCTTRTFLMALLLGVLLIYYPLEAVLSAWLPQYAESLRYMALTFPLIVYEGKTVLLLNTYLNALRQEALILKINLLSLVLSLLVTLVAAVVLKNLDLTVAAIVLVLAVRCIAAEVFLAKILQVSVRRDLVLEGAMTVAFMLSGWLADSWLVVLAYASAYGLYLLLKRNDMAAALRDLKVLTSDSLPQ